jgi:hypothetical protein
MMLRLSISLGLTAILSTQARSAPVVAVQRWEAGYAILSVSPPADFIDPSSSTLSIQFVGSERYGQITDALISEINWPTPLPGTNPRTGEPISGLWLDLPHYVQASFQSLPLYTTDPVDFLRIRIAPGFYGQIFDFNGVVSSGENSFPFSGSFGFFADNFADMNNDQSVDLLDLSILGRNFGRSPASVQHGDLNGDSIVNLLDLGILGSSWTGSQSIAVPEPNGMLMLLLLAGFGISRRY